MKTRVFSTEMVAGLMLMAAAVLAVGVANSPLQDDYKLLKAFPLAGHGLAHWVNDALMALFFLLVGLEIKREMLVGELATWRQRILPGMAALGGMVVPAGIYATMAWGTEAVHGWAIPTATDIAFALGVLALLGSRVPVSLKVFLTALAILDDLGAISIIAVVYSDSLAWLPLLMAALVMLVLWDVNRMGVRRLEVYAVLGMVLWGCVYASGLHATLAGVLLAMAVPLRMERSPLLRMEHALMPWVGFLVVPVFGFFNAGVNVQGLGVDALATSVTLGIVAGLLVGKQVGVGLGVWAGLKLLKAPAPKDASLLQLYGVAVLCGIGFTMSLFIGGLALPEALMSEVRVGILAASLVAALVGYAVLYLGHKKAR